MFKLILILSLFVFKIFGKSIVSDDNPRIIIIGAGVSGVAALSELLENGYSNVLLLEAENRIGGRIETVRFGSNVADFGAQWVHGEEDNVIFDMVRKHGVLDKTPYSWVGLGGVEGNYYSSKGQEKSDYRELAELARSISKDSEKDIKRYVGSTGVFFSGQLRKFLNEKEYKHINKQSAEEFIDHWEKLENIDDASDSWFQTSASGYNQYWDCEGWENLNWKDNGFQTVFDFITRKRPNPRNDLQVERKVLLNKEVKNIKWDNKGEQSIKVSCADGTIYEADHVIVTVSLGVLKHNYKFLFTPELPIPKQHAIEGLSFGTMDKLLMEFERPFWPSEWSGFGMIWTKDDLETVKQLPYSWIKDIAGFWRIAYQPNVLFAFTFGETARKLETMDKAEVMQGVLFLFDKFLSNRMNYTAPKTILTTDWFSRPNFRGSYSYRSLTTDAFKTSASQLAMPIKDKWGTPRILFAGEATHTNYYSTVHGAIESGYREAERIIDYHDE